MPVCVPRCETTRVAELKLRGYIRVVLGFDVEALTPNIMITDAR